MIDAGFRQPGKKRVLQNAALLAGALFVTWSVVRSTAAEAVAERESPWAAVLAPSDPRVIFALSMTALGKGGGRIDPARAGKAAETAERAPLAEEPFVVAAAATVGDEARAARLAKEALRRNPRSRAARLFLLESYLKAGKVEDAAREITILGRLLPSAGKVLIPALAKFSTEPRASVALSTALRADERMRRHVLEYLVATGADPDIVVRVAGRSGAEATANGQPSWQRLLVDRLVREGKPESAYTFWRSFAGIDPAQSTDAMFDGRFAGTPGSPPFTWQFFANESGVAEPAGARRLQLDYYGKEPVTLARKLLLLPPNSYRLGLTLEGRAGREGSRLALRLDCFGRGPRLAQIILASEEGTDRQIADMFAIPAQRCPAQWLSFVGIPGEIAESRALAVGDLQIVRNK